MSTEGNTGTTQHSTGSCGTAAEPTPQQLIAESAKATAEALTNALTARSASIALLTYDWNSKDAYRSFSLFQQTLDNWLFLNCVNTDSEDHL